MNRTSPFTTPAVPFGGDITTCTAGKTPFTGAASTCGGGTSPFAVHKTTVMDHIQGLLLPETYETDQNNINNN